MPLRHPARASLLVMLLGLLALACTADLAAAQADTSCRGSAARATVPGVADAEPVVANASADPCVTDAGESVNIAPVFGLTFVNARADTVRSAGIVGASAGIEHVTGTVAGLVPIAVGVISAQQAVTCESGTPVARGSSSVDSLSIGGTALPQVVGSAPVDVTVPTPAGDIRVRANQHSGDTRTALILDLPGGAQAVLGEAKAAGDACRALPGSGGGSGPGGSGPGGSGPGGSGPGGSGPGGSANVCPQGAQYVVTDNLCVIRAGVAGARAETIVVGRPFEGPSGGSVVPLDAAQALRRQALPERCGSEVRDRRHEPGRPDHGHQRP